MSETDCRREGVRVSVNSSESISAIIYPIDGDDIPELCDEYEINLGGIKIYTHFNTQVNARVKVSLFDNKKNSIEIDSTVIKLNINDAIIKFDQLGHQQCETLCKILTSQQCI